MVTIVCSPPPPRSSRSISSIVRSEEWICHQFFWRWYNWTRQRSAQLRNVLAFSTIFRKCAVYPIRWQNAEKKNIYLFSLIIIIFFFDFLLLRLTVSSRQSVHISPMHDALNGMVLFIFLSFFFPRRTLSRLCSTFIRFRLQMVMLRFIHNITIWHRQRRQRRQRPVSDRK